MVDENKYLTPKLCKDLKMEKINKPTYYQINIFVNVLSSQSIQFNRNYGLSGCTILDSGRFDDCVIRSFIINKFIDLTSYFTKSAFTELLIEQKGVQTLIQSKKKAKSKDGELKPLKEITKDYVFQKIILLK